MSVTEARLSLTLLGDFQARLGSGAPLRLRTRKTQALLAYLASPPGQTHSRDKLASLLWGDRSQPQARSRLRGSLFALRRALAPADPPCLAVGSETLAINTDALDVDTVVFTRLAQAGDPEGLARAVELYRGDFLEGLAFRGALFEDWLMTERERLRELAMDALARLLAHQRSARAGEAAVQTGVRLLALDPLQESVHRTLMRLYAELGRRPAALRQYQQCVAVLHRELGVEPEPETKHLYQELLRRPAQPGLAADSRGARPGRAAQHSAQARLDLPATDTPLFGREAELGQLRQLLDDTLRGHGRLATVTGEAGIGKTRLLSALATDALQRNCRVLIGRCHESDSILPFGPWVDACRRGELSGDEAILGALRPTWRAELTRLLPEAQAVGLPPASDSDLQLFEAVAQLVEQAAVRQPLVLMLEDLHWADEMSLRLLAFVSRRLQQWAALVVTTAREEELVDAPAARRTVQELARETQTARLVLPPLARPDTERLVQAVARAGGAAKAAARLAAEVWVVSEGNPFVAIETTRALQEGMALPDARTLSLPHRVRELIASHLERLSARARDLASLAAVIGREFEFPLLQRAGGLDEHATAEGVEELVRRHVLRALGDRFDFSHHRVHAVVYDQLLPPQRRLRHRRVGEALEGLYASNLGPHYLSLGTHFREGEVWDKALAHFRQAGVNAVARSAYREATASFEQALLALGHLPEGEETTALAIDIRIDLRNALFPLADWARMGEHLHEAETLARRLGDRRRLAWIATFMVRQCLITGNYDEAVRFGQEALTIARTLGDRSIEALVMTYLGQTYVARGEFSVAATLLEPTELGEHVGEVGPGVHGQNDGRPKPLIAQVALEGDVTLGPATTAIDSPHLRSRRRLNRRCLFHLPRALPLTSMHGKSLEIDVGIEWESGNWTRIP